MTRLVTCVLVLVVVAALAPVWLPASLVEAAPRTRIMLDPGHGGGQIGAAYRFADGVVLQEKTLNLQVAVILRDLLQQGGFVVELTRGADVAVNSSRLDLNGDGRVSLADELQARVDLANAAGSDLFVSICFNGSSDPSARGAETFWNPKRTFSAKNQLLAVQVQNAMVADLAAAGYVARDRGAHTDSSLLNGDSFFLLGPVSGTIARSSRMPAIIAEPLFLTNPGDASALRDQRVVKAVARGFFDGIQAYFRTTPPPSKSPGVRSGAGAAPPLQAAPVRAARARRAVQPLRRRLSARMQSSMGRQG